MSRFVIGLWLLLASGSAAAEASSAWLEVGGEALLKVVADQASISLTVISSGRLVEATMADNSARLQRVRQALLDGGVTESDLVTQQFAVVPQWSPRPRDAQDQWQPMIIGYQVRNQLKLTSGELQHLPRWIELAVAAGANQLGQLHFHLADRAAVEQQALTLATQDAKNQAQIVAAAAGRSLGELRWIKVGSAPQSGPMPVRMEAMALRAGASPAIEPGEIEVRATVTARFSLQ